MKKWEISRIFFWDILSKVEPRKSSWRNFRHMSLCNVVKWNWIWFHFNEKLKILKRLDSISWRKRGKKKNLKSELHQISFGRNYANRSDLRKLETKKWTKRKRKKNQWRDKMIWIRDQLLEEILMRERRNSSSWEV